MPATPTFTPEQRRTQREERVFRQGQEAAARLIRALAAPDRAVQIAVARTLVDAAESVEEQIIRALGQAYEQVRWEREVPEAARLPNLRAWHSGPDATDAEPADCLPVTVPV